MTCAGPGPCESCDICIELKREQVKEADPLTEWQRRPTVELPVFTPEECDAEAMRRVRGGGGR